MTPGPKSGSSKTILVVVLVLAGACAFCSVGVVILGGVGFLTASKDLSTPAPVLSADREVVTFVVPPPFHQVSEGRYTAEQTDGPARYVVEVIRLPAIDAADPIESLNAQWRATIVRDWPGAPEQVLPLRRFANNGARVYFTSASLQQQGAEYRSLVSLYLVSADERFEPFVTVQSFFDSSAGAPMRALGASDVTHPLIEALFKGISGSPVGNPLIDDAEVSGRWQHSSGNQMQFVNVLTGSTGYTAVASGTWWTFEPNHEFSYKFSGAVTNTGATQFSAQSDSGTWRVEHDVLVTDGETLDRKYFIVGAGRGPSGKRTLYLMPEGNWTLSPGGLA